MRSRTAKALAALSYDDIRRSRAAIGSPAMLVDQFTEWQEVLDIDGVVMELKCWQHAYEEQINTSVRLIAEDVMPALGRFYSAGLAAACGDFCVAPETGRSPE